MLSVSLINIVAAALLISTLIFIHELGHFLFAKAFGVGVRSFSIGFGRRLVGFVHNGTDYKICVLPFGGYVLMEGADPFLDDEEMEDEKASQSSLLVKPIWQRLLIVAAGPLFNLLLPVVLFTGLYMSGEPRPAPVVGAVYHESMAEAEGLQVDDRIHSINGQELVFWMELYPIWTIELFEDVVLEVSGPDRCRPSALRRQTRSPLNGRLGPLEWTRSVQHQNRGGWPNSPAGRAGLQLGDRVQWTGDVEDFSGLLSALNKDKSSAI